MADTGPVVLAKDCVDVGLYTNRYDEMATFYLTVQVRDVRAAYAHLVATGWTEGRAPVRLGDTAFISFVRDPGGSWIEVSQRASLTGPLPD